MSKRNKTYWCKCGGTPFRTQKALIAHIKEHNASSTSDDPSTSDSGGDHMDATRSPNQRPGCNFSWAGSRRRGTVTAGRDASAVTGGQISTSLDAGESSFPTQRAGKAHMKEHHASSTSDHPSTSASEGDHKDATGSLNWLSGCNLWAGRRRRGTVIAGRDASAVTGGQSSTSLDTGESFPTQRAGKAHMKERHVSSTSDNPSMSASEGDHKDATGSPDWLPGCNLWVGRRRRDTVIAGRDASAVTGGQSSTSLDAGASTRTGQSRAAQDAGVQSFDLNLPPPVKMPRLNPLPEEESSPDGKLPPKKRFNLMGWFSNK